MAGLKGRCDTTRSAVRWTTPIDVPATAKPGAYHSVASSGFTRARMTSDCDLPQGADIPDEINRRRAGRPGCGGAARIPSDRICESRRLGGDARAAAFLPHRATPAAARKPVAPKEEPLALWTAIGFGLLGGFILNFMPCVLPVIGLKLLSFLEQGGKSRAHVFALNVCYTLGLLAVFMVLATLAAFWGFAWGERSTVIQRRADLRRVRHGAQLSGSLGNSDPWLCRVGQRASKWRRERERSAPLPRAILTTILATPCSGPFLGAVFAFCARQPPQTVYLIFASIGLGMALPYLVIGAFPG